MKRFINDLTPAEKMEALKINSKLSELVYETVNEDLQFYADEILYNFKNINSVRYSLGYCEYYFRVNFEHDYAAFLEACADVEKDFCIFTDDLLKDLENIDRIIDRAKYFCDYSYDMSDENAEKLGGWLESKINAFCSGLANFFYALFEDIDDGLLIEELENNEYYADIYFDENLKAFRHVDYIESL